MAVRITVPLNTIGNSAPILSSFAIKKKVAPTFKTIEPTTQGTTFDIFKLLKAE